MNIEEEIRNAIANLVKRNLPPVQVRDAVVLEVDWNSRTCHVQLNDDTEIWDVRLRAAISDPAETSGFCCKPKVNSQVLVAMVEGLKDNAFVCMFTDIDAIEIIQGSTAVLTIDLTAGQITMNGGNNDGLVKIQPLITKINNLENVVNSLIAFVNALVLPVAGAAAGPVAVPFAQTIAPVTMKADLENTKVKH